MSIDSEPTDPVMCARCRTRGADCHQGRRWCTPCGIWLTLDEPTGEWVSPADELARRAARRANAETDQAQRAMAAALPAIRPVLRHDWSLAIGPHSIELRTPARTSAHVIAYLTPLSPDFRHWNVRIRDLRTGVSASLFSAGGAHAARYTDVAEAASAAARHTLHP